MCLRERNVCPIVLINQRNYQLTVQQVTYLQVFYEQIEFYFSYRFITDSCETADGFAESVCTKLTNSNGGGASIVGVKFTRDPINWAQTGIFI